MPAVNPIKDDLRNETMEDLNSENSGNEEEDEEHSKLKKTLELEKQRREGEVRQYSLGEMSDLQSRLMLVTGKADAGRESIERFTSVCR